MDRDAFVRECLTTPFDRELVQCAVDRDVRGQKRCWSDYARRYQLAHGEP